MTTKPDKVTPVKASLAFLKEAPKDFYSLAMSVYTGMNGNFAWLIPR